MTDKTELQTAIDSAVESATAGLKSKNTELLNEIKKLRKGQEIDPQTVTDLESKIDDLQSKLNDATKQAKDATKQVDAMKAQLDNESSFSRNLLIENGLNDGLVGLGVKDPDYLAAARAMFISQAQVAEIDGKRVVKLGEKPLQDALKDWGATESAKKFIAAPQNGGGGSNGGRSGENTGGKTKTRVEWDNMNQAERSTFAREGGTVVDA